MSVSCNPSDLAELAKCFRCIPAGRIQAIKTYLLCEWVNGSTPPCVIPDPPTALDADNITSEGFTAHWIASAGADGYYLDVNDAADFTGTAYMNNVDVGNVTSLVSSDVFLLDPETTVYYRVRAYNTCGTSASSNVITVTTAAFGPDSIAGLVLWLDANVGLTLSGGVVTHWADQSASANTAESPLGREPTYNATGLNGKPTLDFDGTNLYLACANPVVAGFPMTVFAVINNSAAPSVLAAVIGSYDGADHSLLYVYASAVGTVLDYYDNGGDSRTADGSFTLNTPFVLGMTNDGTNPPSLYNNGVLKANSISSSSGGIALDLAPVYIGAFDDVGTYNFLGSISEIIVYDTVLSAGDRVAVEDYLKAKWAI